MTDEEWSLVEPLLPKKKLTCPPKWTKRQILDGIFYQLKNGALLNQGMNDNLAPIQKLVWV
jgi:transposase